MNNNVCIIHDDSLDASKVSKRIQEKIFDYFLACIITSPHFFVLASLI